MRRPDFLFATTYPIAFDEGRLERAALGGSETAVVELSRCLAGRGLEVEVHAPAPRVGLRQGVRWARVDQLERALTARQVRPRVLVICRDAELARLADHADQAWLWLQDMPMEGLRRIFRAAVSRVDRVLCISDYQARRFARVHGITQDMVRQRFVRTRNGVDTAAHATLMAAPGAADQGRISDRCVYASTPFRGLAPLLDAWPAIHQAVPGATLELFGGMSAYDQPDTPFDELYRRARQLPGVLLTGAVPQAQLMAGLRRAELLLYPCLFREAGCIVTLMAMAAGAPPVTSDIACLPEYLGQCGVVVPGNPRGGGDPARQFIRRFADQAVQLLQRPTRLAELRQRCLARDVGWEPVAEQWLGWATGGQ